MAHHDSGPIRRVLVVEDDPVCRRYTSEALRQAGSTVKQTGCIRRALHLALAWRPQLVLTDLHLPDGSGTELARRLRADWPRGHAPPLIVAITADAGDTVDGAFLRVLRKPFAPSELAGLIVSVREHPPTPGKSADAAAANERLRRLARRELLRQFPRMAARLEAGRLESAAALAHRLSAAAAICGAMELGWRLQVLSNACADGPLPAELAEAFTAARRLARDLTAGVVPGPFSG